MIVVCPYCNKPAKWCDNKEVYGKRYGKSYMCYYCKDCGAWVGCHQNTRKPLGTMANRELRIWRMKAHSALDPLWKSGEMTRHKAYKLIDNKHIGESNIDGCKEIIRRIYES